MCHSNPLCGGKWSGWFYCLCDDIFFFYVTVPVSKRQAVKITFHHCPLSRKVLVIAVTSVAGRVTECLGTLEQKKKPCLTNRRL